MSKAITTFFLLIVCYSVSAQVYWNGGDGKWSVASNWSTGQVPTSADSVVIDTEDARVLLNEGVDLKIKALYLGFRAHLTIDEDISLLVTGGGGNAIESLSGKFFIHGTLEVSNAAHSGMSLNGRNQFNPTRIENSGTIEVSGSGRGGISGGILTLVNDGTIISESNTFSGISIGHDNGIDINNGTIISRNNGSGMKIKTNEFLNYGSIEISNNDGNGLTIQGNLYNDNEVRISNSDLRGIEIGQGGSMRNSDQSSLIDISDSGVGALVWQGSEIANYGIFNISTSATTGLELIDSSTYKAIGLNELTIDGAGTGISISGSSFIDLLGATVIITNIGVNGIIQRGTSMIEANRTSNISITHTSQSAYKLFDDSSSLFYQGAMFITDNISGSDVFSVNDNAILTMADGAEMVIGI